MKDIRSVMRINVKLLISVMLLIILMICCGCEENTPEPAPVHETDVIMPLEGEGAYVVVRPEKASKEEIALTTELRKIIEEKTGVTVQLKDDFVREGTKFTTSDTEICFGATKREESKQAYEGLKLNDYRIRLDGTKLVIAYGSVATGRKALERFVEDLFT